MLVIVQVGSLFYLHHNKVSYRTTGFIRPLDVRKVKASRISRQSTNNCGKFVSCTHRPPLLPAEDSCYSFLLISESTPGSIIPSEIEPCTFRFVAQPLTQLRDQITTSQECRVIIDCSQLLTVNFRIFYTITYHRENKIVFGLQTEEHKLKKLKRFSWHKAHAS